MAGSISLTDFKNSVQDVARGNRFFCSITGAGDGMAGGWDETKSFLAKSASLPNRVIGSIELGWQGMKAKIAGDPTFDSITLVCLNDYEWNIKTYFETWLEGIATMSTNVRTAHADYKAEIIIEQLGRDGETIATYKLLGAFPTSMDAIDLSTENYDQVEELSITIEFDEFERS